MVGYVKSVLRDNKIDWSHCCQIYERTLFVFSRNLVLYRMYADLIEFEQRKFGAKIRPFPSCCEPRYESEARCTAFPMKISFVCM